MKPNIKELQRQIAELKQRIKDLEKAGIRQPYKDYEPFIIEDKDDRYQRWKTRPFFTIKPSTGCLHHDCPECHGTGRKQNGATCIHMLSCPCPKCTPYCCIT